MFDAALYGVPPGTDFPRSLIAGLRARLEGQPPEAMARVQLYVNTRRMQRRLVQMFQDGPPSFLPQIKLVTDLARDHRFADIPPPVPALRRRLELSQLVAKLLDKEPHLAPRHSLYDLSDSLAALLDEMQGEGVPPEILHQLEVSDVSGHWQRTKEFVSLVEPFFADDAPATEARQRMVVERLAAEWQDTPPDHPVIVAGSTGSRGATAIFMESVARLPNGAVVLPGVDFDMTPLAWAKLDRALHAEDHPQYRFAAMAARLGMDARQIKAWAETSGPDPARNRLISLSLRPAPVTDQWLTEGQHLTDLATATQDMTLIEAEHPRAEASAIALLMRHAAEEGVTAALICPDRVLTRQVTAALDRWGIVPDDSAGRPLALSPPGRLFRQVAAQFGRRMTSDALLGLLKHPLVATGSDRGQHLLMSRELEMWLRRKGPAYVTGDVLIDWCGGKEAWLPWAMWLRALLAPWPGVGTRALPEHLRDHLRWTEALCAGPSGTEAGELWKEAAGLEAQRVLGELEAEAGHGGTLSPSEYSALFETVLQGGEVRDSVTAHSGVMIWGTLEARVQGADLVILAGLNEGSWPEPPRPDPWLNRVLRDRAGLLLPEREIGLAAHDYQQAVCAPRVVLTRAVRNAEAQTVPSRWLNRLVNLLSGLGEEPQRALAGMRDRGAYWLRLAEAIDTPEAEVAPAERPAPCPPVDARPREISITEVQRLIRDPYAIYASRILGLRALDSLRRDPDARLRGTVLHTVFEDYLKQDLTGLLETDLRRLLELTDQVLADQTGWAIVQRLWRMRVQKLAEPFLGGEYQRQAQGAPLVQESNAEITLPEGTRLYGKIDRIDRLNSGELAVYDYKTGTVPNDKVQRTFDKQLLLSALIAERGGAKGVSGGQVAELGYIGLGSKHSFSPRRPEPGEIVTVLAELVALLTAYQAPERGYASRRAVASTGFEGDYDHLARYGEWDETSTSKPLDVGR